MKNVYLLIFCIFLNGEKCAEANSCETVQVKNERELETICRQFPHCEPGNNNNCKNKCNDITNQEECKYAIKDGEAVIKCKWNGTALEGKKCQVDGVYGYYEIQYCGNAKGEKDMTNELCSKLKVNREGNYCRKGPYGCIEFGDCELTHNVEVEPEICKELTKPDDDLQCIPSNIGNIGCKRYKVKCLDNSLYIYDKIKCEKLAISSEGYKCLSNGKECIEVNSCDSVKNTTYETNSNELKNICNSFDNCEPYKKGCKTKYIPTTIITTIPTTVPTTVPTTIPTTVPTTVPTTIPTTVPTTVPTTIPTTVPTTVPTTIVTTLPTTVPTTVPTTIVTTLPTTVPTTVSTTIAATEPTTIVISTNIPTSFSTNMLINLLNESTIIKSIKPTTTQTAAQIHVDSTVQTITPKTTMQSIFSTTMQSTKETNGPSSIKTNISTNEPKEEPTTIETTIKTKEPTIIPSNIKTTIPTSISSTGKVIIPSGISTNISTIMETIAQTELKDTTLINNTLLPTEINSQKKEEETELVSKSEEKIEEKSTQKSTNESYIIKSQKTNQMNIQNTFTQILETNNTNRVIALSTESNEIKETLSINSQDNNIINTNLKATIVSSVYSSDTIVPNITNIEEASAILLGMNLFKYNESSFSFNLYLLILENYIYSNNLKAPVTVDYNSNIRLLKELEANCNLNKIYDGIKYEYECVVEAEISNIKQIKLNPEFNFLSQGNIKLSETPFARMFMDHLELIDEKYDNFGNSNFYLLDNSTYNIIDKSIFEIHGSIKDPQPELYENQSLKIMISTESNDESTIELDCNLTHIKENNYTLTCKNNYKLSIYLQSAISFIDNNNILIINFEDNNNTNNNSIINVDTDNTYRRFFSKKKDNIGTGTIIIIVIIPVLVVLATIIGLVIYLRKKNMIKSNTNEESVVKKFNGKDDSSQIYN